MNTDLRFIPLGTHVVTRVPVATPSGDVTRPVGAVGVIVRVPSDPVHAYRVRFPDGAESSFSKRELDVRKHHKQFDAPEPPNWLSFVHLRCVVGSRAFGLETEASDTDRRGFYLPPADLHWSLWGVPEQLEDHGAQEAYWELQKFLSLALKANPNVLECLYTPLVERASPLAHELLVMREAFLSTLVYQTYNGYVLSQFKKLDADVRNHGEIRWKHAMHLIRLLISGITVLEQGEVLVHVGEHKAALLAIKRGEVAWSDVNAWRLDLHARFDRALPRSRLPERPDYARVNAFLIEARRAALHDA